MSFRLPLSTLAACLAWMLALSSQAQENAAPGWEMPGFVTCQATRVEPRSGDFRVAAMGDLVFAGREAANAGVFRDIAPLARQAQFVFGNLEGVITERETPVKKYVPGRSYAFRFPASTAQTLAQTPVHAVTIANNHSSDYGPEGFADSQELLRQAGVQSTGLKGSYSLQTYAGKRVALIGFAYYTRFNDINDITAAVDLVRQVRPLADLLVVTYHGGAEGSPAAWLGDEPEVFMGEARGHPRAFARAVVEAGADLVVGHGPHVVRASECIQGKPVIHSIGNFVSAGGLSAKQLANVAVYFEAVFTPQMGLRGVRVVPVTFDAARLPVLDPSGRGVLLMNWLSRQAKGQLQSFEPLVFNGFEDKQATFEQWFREQAVAPLKSPPPGGIQGPGKPRLDN